MNKAVITNSSYIQKLKELRTDKLSVARMKGIIAYTATKKVKGSTSSHWIEITSHEMVQHALHANVI